MLKRSLVRCVSKGNQPSKVDEKSDPRHYYSWGFGPALGFTTSGMQISRFRGRKPIVVLGSAWNAAGTGQSNTPST